jgi:hypothetical protein
MTWAWGDRKITAKICRDLEFSKFVQEPPGPSAHGVTELLSELRDAAELLLEPRGRVAYLRPIASAPGAEILRWRSASRRLPAALWCAACSVGHCAPVERVRVLDPTLGELGPVAHLHVHAGAVRTFEGQWLGLLWDFNHTTNKEREKKFREEPVPPCMRQGQWEPLLRVTARVRAILDCGVRRRLSDEERRVLVAWADGNIAVLIRDHLRSATDACAEFGMKNPRRGGSPAVPGGEGGSTSAEAEIVRIERTFLWEVLRFTHSGRFDGDSEMKGVLLAGVVQYLRVMVEVCHRVVQQEESEIGLGAFGTHFERIWRYAPDACPAIATVIQGLSMEPDIQVDAVEVRLAPAAAVGAMEGGDLGDVSETCVVAHFIREKIRPEDGGDGVGVAVTSGRKPKPRHHEAYRKHLRLAGRLEIAIREYPRKLTILRGLDLAGKERDHPVWVSLPAFRRVLAAADDAGALGGAPLRMTLHVGEDFAHPATGLRAIHEPFAWHFFRRGDRLGHALALGLKLQRWSDRHGLRPRRWERLLDLAWMRYASVALVDVPMPGELLEVLDVEALHRAHEVFDRHGRLASGEVERLWGSQQSGRFLDRLALGWLALGHPHLPCVMDLGEAFLRPPTDELRWPPLGPAWGQAVELPPASLGATSVSMRWLHHYLVDPEVQRAADEPLDLTWRASELEWLGKVQVALAQRVAHWQATVEVNPSSNQLVAGLDHPLDQPMFALRPVDPSKPGVVPVTISADDPITFATCLADEYAYVWAGLVHGGGVAPSHALKWLEESARQSMRARFSLPRGAKGRV